MRAIEAVGRRWARIRWARHRWAAWVAVVGLAAAGLFRVETTNHTAIESSRTAERAAAAAQDALERLEQERRLDQAEACVSSWDLRRGVRGLMEAIIARATGADPAEIEALRADMAMRLPDPDCDLAAAELVVPGPP